MSSLAFAIQPLNEAWPDTSTVRIALKVGNSQRYLCGLQADHTVKSCIKAAACVFFSAFWCGFYAKSRRLSLQTCKSGLAHVK